MILCSHFVCNQTHSSGSFAVPGARLKFILLTPGAEVCLLKEETINKHQTFLSKFRRLESQDTDESLLHLLFPQNSGGQISAVLSSAVDSLHRVTMTRKWGDVEIAH